MMITRTNKIAILILALSPLAAFADPPAFGVVCSVQLKTGLSLPLPVSGYFVPACVKSSLTTKIQGYGKEVTCMLTGNAVGLDYSVGGSFFACEQKAEENKPRVKVCSNPAAPLTDYVIAGLATSLNSQLIDRYEVFDTITLESSEGELYSICASGQ